MYEKHLLWPVSKIPEIYILKNTKVCITSLWIIKMNTVKPNNQCKAESERCMVWNAMTDLCHNFFDTTIRCSDVIWCGDNVIWCGENLIWCGDNVIWCGDNVIWCGDNVIWCGDNVIWCGDNVIWCGNNVIRCGDKWIRCDDKQIWCSVKLI